VKRVKHFARMYFASCGIALTAALLLVPEQGHSDDELAVVIALPLILLQVVPYLLLKIPHEDPATGALENISFPVRASVYFAGLSFFGVAMGLCILGSLPFYHLLAVDWAIEGGAAVGAILVVSGSLLLVLAMYIMSRLNDVNFVRILFEAASHEAASTEGDSIATGFPHAA